PIGLAKSAHRSQSVVVPCGLRRAWPYLLSTVSGYYNQRTPVVLGVPVEGEFSINASFFPFPVVAQVGRGVIDGGRQRNQGTVFILDLKVDVSDLEFISWHHGRFPHSTAIDEGSVSRIQILHQHRPLNHVKLAMQ